MLSFLKKLFGAKPAEPTPVPYKVEVPAAKAVAPAKPTKPKAEKKTAVQAKPARKPKTPK